MQKGLVQLIVNSQSLQNTLGFAVCILSPNLPSVFKYVSAPKEGGLRKYQSH